MTMAS